MAIKAASESSRKMAVPKIMRIALRNCPGIYILCAVSCICVGSIQAVNTKFLQRFFDSALALIQNGGSANDAVRHFALIALLGISNEFVTSIYYYMGRALDSSAACAFAEEFNKKLAKAAAVCFEDHQFLNDLERARAGQRAAVSALSSLTAVFTSNLSYLVIMYAVLHSIHFLLPLAILLAFIPVLAGQFLHARLFSNLEEQMAPIRRESLYYEKCIRDKEFFIETRQLNATDFFFRKYLEALALFNKKAVQTEQKSAAVNLASSAASEICYASVLMLLFALLARNQISAGSFTAVFASIGMMFANLKNMADSQVTQISKNYGSIISYFDFIEREERTGGACGIRPGDAIHFSNVSFQYPNAHAKAVFNASFDIAPGETVAIVGKNGSGKTTLARLIMGLYLPASGVAAIGRQQTKDIAQGGLRSKWSAVFQKYQRYKMTLGENVSISDPKDELDSGQAEARVREALQRAGVVAGGFQNGLGTMLSRDFGGVDLSGGQWQRIAIARSIYRPHDFIIMDEPTSSIDPVEETKLYELFSELSRNKTAVLITHRIGAARIADRILVMDGGRIVEQGTYQDLIDRKGAFYDLYEAQAKWYQKD
ncbi:MAG: ABC transporter ATP-binding protein/permease [Clostridiales bacterium]|nr:ABC transporter ATP-binding protein/permease [Clostridiales bacterium]